MIITPNLEGYHNANTDTNARLEKSKTYRDLSTVIICPTRGTLQCEVVQSWMGLIKPMNQKVVGPIFAKGMEVGEAYNETIKGILADPNLSSWKYILTIEEDNLPPPDGLMKLYESMDDYDVVGGLYWTKGEEGQPMIYGDPTAIPFNFIPQMPKENTVQRANGLGMGFILFKIDIFNKMPYPWFKTLNEYDPMTGSKVYTQDLYFYENAGKAGFKFACDTRVRVGHMDVATGFIW